MVITPVLPKIKYVQQGKFIDESLSRSDQHCIKRIQEQNGKVIKIRGGADDNLDDATPFPDGICNRTATSHGFFYRDRRYKIEATSKDPIDDNRLKQCDPSHVNDRYNIIYGNYSKVASDELDATCLRVPITHKPRQDFQPCCWLNHSNDLYFGSSKVSTYDPQGSFTDN